MGTVTIGNVPIGPDEPVRIIAELGICHRGDVSIAKEMIRYAAEAEVDFIKFEIYQLDTVLTKPYREHTTITYETAKDGVISQNLFQAFKGGYLSFDQAREVIAEIRKTGIPFFATACSKQEIDFLREEHACAVKLSSGEVDNYPLIRYVADLRFPVFIDTAKTYLWEIVRSAEEFRLYGGKDIVLMVNPPGYPAPAETVDLKRIHALQTFLEVPVGFSCHTPGRDVIMTAIGMGACIIEKPMAPDNTLPYIEYVFSENMKDYKDFTNSVRNIGKTRGKVSRIWPRDVMKEQLLNRHGLVAKRSIPKGHRLTEADVDIARPGYGIRPEHFGIVINRTLKRDLDEGEVISWEDI